LKASVSPVPELRGDEKNLDLVRKSRKEHELNRFSRIHRLRFAESNCLIDSHATFLVQWRKASSSLDKSDVGDGSG
jgi:hypothetical protein